MGDFIKEAQLIRQFPSKNDSCLLNVGYDDFSYVKPATAFRVQNYCTWHFVLSGSGILEMNGKKYSIAAGEMFFIPPNVKMRYFPKKEDPWEYVWFSLSSDIGLGYGEILGFSRDESVKGSRYFQRIKSVLKKMTDTLYNEDSGYFTALSGFYEIMEICTEYSPRTGIQNVKMLIDESFSMPEFSVKQLCRDAGLSHAQLLRQFKAAYGVTVIGYVIKKRIDLAQELLLTTDLSVKSVAYSCGFSDEVHFMKTFKRENGISAMNYKKNHKKTDKTAGKSVDL